MSYECEVAFTFYVSNVFVYYWKDNLTGVIEACTLDVWLWVFGMARNKLFWCGFPEAYVYSLTANVYYVTDSESVPCLCLTAILCICAFHLTLNGVTHTFNPSTFRARWILDRQQGKPQCIGPTPKAIQQIGCWYFVCETFMSALSLRLLGVLLEAV